MHIFQLIEDAVVSALSPLKDQGVRTVQAYAGDVDAGIVEALADLPRRMPALLVSVGNLTIEVRNRVDVGLADVKVVVCTRHLQGIDQAVRGRGSPGLYELMEQTEQLLNGRKVVPGWSGFRWMGVQKWTTGTNRSLAVYLEHFRTTAPLDR